MISLEVPCAVPSLANMRGTWNKARAVKKMRETVRIHLDQHRHRRPASGTLLRVTLARKAARRLDGKDNHPGALKPARDEIAAWLGYRSDDVPHIEWCYGEQQRPHKGALPGYQAVLITIELVFVSTGLLVSWLEANAPPCGQRDAIAGYLRRARG